MCILSNRSNGSTIRHVIHAHQLSKKTSVTLVVCFQSKDGPTQYTFLIAYLFVFADGLENLKEEYLSSMVSKSLTCGSKGTKGGCISKTKCSWEE